MASGPSLINETDKIPREVPTLDRLFPHGDPITGIFKAATISELLALISGVVPTIFYADLASMLANTTLTAGFFAFVSTGSDGWAIYLYIGGTRSDIASYRLVVSEGGGFTTREFGRAFSETLIFDKNEIVGVPFELTGNLSFQIGVGGLVDQFSTLVQEIVTDGTHSISFSSGFKYILGNFVNGSILPSGTYEIHFLYINGVARANILMPNAEDSAITVLTAPTNFVAVADGENAIDLSWTDVANESSYLIEFSLDGSTGWTELDTPAAGSTTSTQTGLNEGDQRFYRIKAIGDGIAHTDSPWATTSGTTEDSGDITAPTFTFNPANGNAVWTINRPLTITADEEIRNSADGSLIDSTDLLTIITLKETNSGGADIPFTATIDVTKTIITVTPTAGYGVNQLVYLAIDDVEDVSGNEITLQSITFTTTAFTYLNGTSNRMVLGDILDSVFCAANASFWLEITTNNTQVSGIHFLISKFESATNLRSIALLYSGTTIYFNYWLDQATDNPREIAWTGAMDSGEHEWVLKYDGSIDTNNGLDRVILEKDGVVVGSKTLSFASGSLTDILVNTTAPLTVGAGQVTGGTANSFYTEEMKDFKVRSAAGSVLEIDIPVLFDGTDNSGNNRDGTWV
jgi:hypothetical protein